MRHPALATLLLLGACSGEPEPTVPTAVDPGEDTAGPLDSGEAGPEVIPPFAELWSAEHGLITEAFTLSLTNPLGVGELRYTLDASPPTDPGALVYTEALEIDTTTVVRAAVVDPDDGTLFLDGGTRTWVRLDAVADQQPGPSWPEVWWSEATGGPYAADTTLDAELIATEADRAALVEALGAYPVVALTVAPTDLFGETGIHEHPTERGSDWERAATIEIFEPGATGDTTWQAGVRIHGGAGRRPDRSPKKSFRLLFKAEHGGDLDYPLFPGAEVNHFDTIVLRAGYNRTWTHYQAIQRSRSLYVREAFTTATHRDMGYPAPQVRPAHLFLNGLYWGVYQLEERPDDHFQAAWLGGEPEDYESLNSGDLVAGEEWAWLALLSLAREDLSLDAHYTHLAELLELPAFVDYMVLNQYLGNVDWPAKNWWAGRNRAEGGGFRFFVWDAEFIQSISTDDVIDEAPAGTPGELFAALRANPEFAVLVGDRVQAAFFHGGPLSQEAMTERWTAIADAVRPGLFAESARWGDHWRDERADGGELYTVDPHWDTENAWVLDYWIPRRQDIYLQQLQDRALSPELAAATLDPFGGTVSAGTEVTITVDQGVPWCTTDGSDPRLPGGVLSTTATVCPAIVEIDGYTVLTVRVLDDETWSAVVTAAYEVED